MQLSAIVLGAPEIIANMGSSLQSSAVACEKGLIKAGLRLQAASQRLVPVEYGPLKASAFTRAVGKLFATVVTVGYTSSYAVPVHEAVAMKLKGKPRPSGKGLFWDPQGQAQAKFLEQPARQLAPQLKADIFQEMRIS